MPVISEPLKELVGGGQNAKYIKECKELHLGNKGIEKIRGFEPFVSLECLWLNGNRLKKINNLDANFRMRVLYAQDNSICTLRGSLPVFRFLQELDLSNNQLRDLVRVLGTLEKFQFLTHLNLKGNPCCEEPDYRLHVVHAIPSLRVLDQHAVTGAERQRARGLIGGDVATLTVAFMRRVPPYDPAWDAKVPERSLLEQELKKEAGTVRDKQRHDEYMRERALLMRDPHPPEMTRGTGLPPNAGTQRAMEAWHAAQQQQEDDAGMHMPHHHGQQQQQQADQFTAGGLLGTAGRRTGTTGKVPLPGMLSDTAALLGAGTGVPRSRSAPSAGHETWGAAAGGCWKPGEYVPRDQLVLYTMRPMHQPAPEEISPQLLHAGPIKFQREKYKEFMTVRTAGRGPWDMTPQVLRV